MIKRLLISCCVLAAEIAWCQSDLSISLVAPNHNYRVGDPIQLYLVYQNRGEQSFFVERPRNLGSEYLSIIARTGRCTFETTFEHFDIAEENLRFFHFPLQPHDRLKTVLPTLNELSGIDRLNLRTPGRYYIRASFQSTGPLRATEAIFPIWRGHVESEEIVLTLDQPEEDLVEKWVGRLVECYSVPPCQDREAIEYFRLVRDERARQILRDMFERDYQYDPRIAEALVNQGNPQDSVLLEIAASDPEIDGDLVEYFRQLSTKLSAPGENCR